MTKDLTEGKIAPQLVRFTIPLVLGNLFQLAYNAADSIIVGRFVGTDALAAVGVAGPVMNVMIMLINGLCIGAGVLMSAQYGARDEDRLKRQISTTMLSGVAISAALALLCVVFARPILRLIRTDPAILELTASYLRLIFAGLIFTYLYNFFSGTLRALGDSRTPLYFLIISSVINVALDLVFVLALRAGVRGCAAATVISQGVSCVLCYIYSQKRIPYMQLGRKWLVFDRTILKTTLAYGWTSAMQQATVHLGKLGVQAVVNTMGVAMTAAFTAVNRVDDFAIVPEQNIAHAMSAHIAQNRGAGRTDRIRKAFNWGLAIELIYGAAVFLICIVLPGPIMRLFAEDEEVIAHGTVYLRLIAAMYLVPAFTNALQGYFRGMGELKVTLISSAANMSTRVLSALVLVFVMKRELEAIPWSYMCGWIVMMATEVPRLVKSIKKGIGNERKAERSK